MRAARELVERAAHGTREHTYGINTGFGRFVSKSIPEEQTEELQLRLLRSHACGVGEPYPDEIVRAAMLLRANALAKGNSGARIETVELLARVPRPRRAAVRAEPRLGRCERRSRAARASRPAARRRGRGLARRRAAARVRTRSRPPGLEPIAARRRRKASRSSTARSSWRRSARSGVVRARRLAKTADIACALSLEALQGSRTSFIPQIHRAAPAARAVATLPRTSSACSKGSAINEAHRWCDKVQDAYSLRCAPQVHGASRDLLDLRRRHGCGRS